MSAQFPGVELAFGDAEHVAAVAIVSLPAIERAFQRDVLSDRFVAPVEVGRERFHRAFEPQAVEPQQGVSVAEPALLRSERFAEPTPAVAAGAGGERALAQPTGAGMHVERRPARRGVGDRFLDAGREERAGGVAPDLAVAEERVAVHELKQVGLDVGAHDAVGLDDGAGLGIDVVPRPAELSPQPAAKRTEQVGEGLPMPVGPTHAFAAGQEVRIKIGLATEFGRAGIPAGPFDDDLVHVRAHKRRG